MPNASCARTPIRAQWRPEGPYRLDVAEFDALSGDPGGRSPPPRPGFTAATCFRAATTTGLCRSADDRAAPSATALERLAALAEDRGDMPAASVSAGWWSTIHPTSPIRSLMRLHALNGDRATALRHHHLRHRVLRRELGVPPITASRRLHEQLLNADAAAAPVPVRPVAATFPALVGRAAEWAQLQAAWRSAAEGAAADGAHRGVRPASARRAWPRNWRPGRRAWALTASARDAAEGALPYAPVAAWLRAWPLRAAGAGLADGAGAAAAGC